METLTSKSPAHSCGPMGAHEFKTFRALIHKETGIWLRDGKEVMLASRLSRRLRLHDLSSFSEYLSYLDSVSDSGAELGELINCVTTNKTSFFRESHHFEFLSSTLVPEAQQRAAGREAKSIRIWSAACSTGEEAYSIVITLLEALQSSALPGAAPRPPGAGVVPVAHSSGAWEVRVTASDIDTMVLHTAAAAVYSDRSLQSVDASLMRKYFLRGKGDMLGQVRVKREVARHVEFKRINLMERTWPLEGLYDAIFFRNALIYFNQQTQDVFLRKMLRYLRPKGYLFLGHSEHVPWLHDVIEPLRSTIYQLRETKR